MKWVVLISIFVCQVAYGSTIGEKFHEDTKHTWTQIVKEIMITKPLKPLEFKEYPQLPKIKLPKPEFRGITVEEALRKRRSIRDYSNKSLSLSEVSQLLWASQGITGKIYETFLRTIPSAGALYPFEIYVFINNVENLKQGLYHYSVRDHCLVFIKEGDFRHKLLKASLEQGMVRDAGAVFVLSAIFDRTRSKYGDRGYRYVYMEAGHISQNIYLQATSLGLGTVVVGAFLDDEINRLLGIDGKKEAVIAIQPIGRP